LRYMHVENAPCGDASIDDRLSTRAATAC
jgi:hypothetical protein